MSQNSAIEIFLRVRPTKKPFTGLAVKPEDNRVEIFIPKDMTIYVNNTREDYTFKFNKVLDQQAKQEEVFNCVAKEVIDSGLEGFNGTIFAYGQTGSGKTFTMTGGAERYGDRGIIPRALSYIFSETKKRNDTQFQVSISYMEIYDDNGYDLLDENHATKNLSDLPKVIPRETNDERLMLSGLSVRKVHTEEDALNLLFIGDTNRVVSETPKNDASTRSHCIFIIQLEACKLGSDIKTTSRIHLVDLSGSERVGKTGVTDVLLKEARFINLSLHYLEHVIVSLNEKKAHVPYRNSLMTMVLRDSLGGNCKTRMVATISAEEPDLEESISTCRFSQRVALIKNTVLRNEAVDPSIIIERLKKENAELRAEIAMLKGGGTLSSNTETERLIFLQMIIESKDHLDPEDIAECKQITDGYIKNKDPSAKILLTDRLKIHECFYHFKYLYNDLLKRYERSNVGQSQDRIRESLGMDNGKSNQGSVSSEESQRLQEEIKKLKLLVQHRDNEILILLNLINKHKAQAESNGENPTVPVYRGEDTDNSRAKNLSIKQSGLDTSMIISNAEDTYTYRQITFPKYDKHKQPEEEKETDASRSLKEVYNAKPVNYKENSQNDKMLGKFNLNQGGLESSSNRSEKSGSTRNSLSINENAGNQMVSKELMEVNSLLATPLNVTTDQLMDRANCFELFRKSYRKNEALEENKELLKEKYAKGKELGQLVNNSRNKINQLKNQIEELRKENALIGLVNNENDVIKHPEEDKLTAEIEKQKNIYKNGFQELKELKADIERIERLLERNRDQLQKDFEKWLAVMMSQRTNTIAPTANPLDLSSRTTQQSTNAGIGKTPLMTSKATNNVLNSSQITVTSNKSAIKGKPVSEEVERNLEAFYKARDEIYSANKK